jgi:predicted O-methyltransferase YrrM
MGLSSQAASGRVAVDPASKLSAWTRGGEEVASLEAVLTHIRSVADLAMCGSPQPEFLFCLSSALRGTGDIVEIGTSVGHSLVALAAAQKLTGGVKVTTIDIARHPLVEDHIKRAQVEEWVDLIVEPSENVAARWSRPIELLWIDGDHEYAGVRRDIDAWSPFVVPGGFVALHDYAPGFGVARAVKDTLLVQPWRWRVSSDREFGNILVFERVDRGAPEAWVGHGATLGTRVRRRLARLASGLRR